MSARELVYQILKADPLLTSMGYGGDAVMPSNTVDSPAATLTRWLMIRWGAAEAPVGRDATARPVPMALWAYNRQRDYGPIQTALWRCRELMSPLAGVPCPEGGHLIAADWSFSSEDLWDDTYEAIMRGETYRVVTTRI